ncbi:radical SAM protein [Candidatus Sumerlaeota bacterium]|nr:radical SAM protein [Candidatus Sumerlaeota bacterium]
MKIALVNTNRIKPPIAPIGLEYVAEALSAAGYAPSILDLCFEDDWKASLEKFFDKSDFDLVGVTLRNTDDCSFNCQSFLGDFSSMIKEVRRHSDAVIVAGGVGFSVMPEQVLQICGADAGIWGDGEFVLPEMAKRIQNATSWHDLPQIIHKHNGVWKRNPAHSQPLSSLPLMNRNFFDNKRYFQEGGQAGIETKRGCPGQCVYCADPIAKGRRSRLRPPEAVVYELKQLLKQGIDHIHACDSEFNIPEDHAKEVCREIIRQNPEKRLRWYAYCSPAPFSRELAHLMRQSGCVGINFGTDSGDDDMLRKLGRNFTSEDITQSVKFCQDENIIVMLDLLLGAPGETKQSVTNTIQLMKKLEPDRVGVVVGVRVYPGTKLEQIIKSMQYEKREIAFDDPEKPVVFLEPAIESFVFELVDELIGEDDRFLFFDPTKPDKNYNYNANEVLVNAIKKGYRGAYWDILRRYSQEDKIEILQ